MIRVDLIDLTKDQVRLIAGMKRGEAARQMYRLDEHEHSDETIVIVAPQSLKSISTSFVQGMLSGGVNTWGMQKLLSKYDFSQLPSALQEDVQRGIDRLRLHH